MGLIKAFLTYSFRNLITHKARSIAAGAGICFALFLIYIQWGFLQAAKKQVTLLYNCFDYDIAILADTYQFMFTAKPFDGIRLMQARALPSVEDTFRLNFALGSWEANDSKKRSSLMLFGVDRKQEFISDVDILRGIDHLTGGRNILVDEFSHSDFGPLSPGTRAVINQQEVEIAAHFNLGMFFYTEGSALVDNTTFSRLTFRPSRDTSFGLIRLKIGFDPELEKAKLEKILPRDVIVLTKAELIDKEQDYFINVKPLGIIFRIGVFIAFITGSVVLFQVISTDIGTRLKEYATLKAMGFGSGLVYGSAFAQILILVLGAFACATILSSHLFAKVYELTHMSVDMTVNLIGFVLIMSLLMCFVISISVLRKLSLAHPVDLY